MVLRSSAFNFLGCHLFAEPCCSCLYVLPLVSTKHAGFCKGYAQVDILPVSVLICMTTEERHDSQRTYFSSPGTQGIPSF